MCVTIRILKQNPSSPKTTSHKKKTSGNAAQTSHEVNDSAHAEFGGSFVFDLNSTLLQDSLSFIIFYFIY